MIRSRHLARLTLAVVLAAALLTGCGQDASIPPATPSGAPTPAATSTPVGTATASPARSPSPTATALPTPAPTPASASPSSPAPTKPPVIGPTVAGFWTLVEREIRDAGRLQVEIAGPNAGTLRFEPGASATVIEGVIGFVCVGRRAYDGQSGFARVPGAWTCGSPALVAGFRNIGQPIDAWNATIPSDDNRRESVVVDGTRWTWRYRATSPFYGGAVTASVTIDRNTGRVTAARRDDPTGVTRYRFRYGAAFPLIAVPD